MMTIPFKKCLILLPGLLWLAGCTWPARPPGGAPVVDRSLRESIAIPPAASVTPSPPPPPAPASEIEVQPLPRPQPIIPQQAYTGPASSEALYKTTPPPEPSPEAAPPGPSAVEAGSAEPAAEPSAGGAAPAGQVASAGPASAPAPTEISRQGNQAVVALLDDAAAHVNKRDWEKAAAALERAVRIEPKNAGIWHDLAQIRLQQRQYEQAESLAAKSNSLAGKDNFVRARNWQLIASARRARGDLAGADAAEAQALTVER